jgi:hypothetical protein
MVYVRWIWSNHRLTCRTNGDNLSADITKQGKMKLLGATLSSLHVARPATVPHILD